MRAKLRIASGFDFMVMVWGAHALASGRESEGLAVFDSPNEGLLERLRETPFFRPWTLETLVNEWLVTKPARVRPSARRIRVLNTRHLGTAVDLINLQDAYENAEDAIVLRRVSVLLDLARLAQREFPWQRGILNLNALYRAARLYMFPLSDQYFREQTGITMESFCKVCFALYASLARRPWLRAKDTLTKVGIADDVRDNAFRLIVASFEESAETARRIRPPKGHPSYSQSALRPKPVVATPDGLIVAPLVDLIMERCTNGLFYDLVSASGEVRRTIGANFESYCRDLLAGYLASATVLPPIKYRVGRYDFESPDALIVRGGNVQLIVECKARRARFEDKFGEGNEGLQDGPSEELVKAVEQIWRFTSDRRQGKVDSPPISGDAIGVVVTLDNWMEFAEQQKLNVVARALERISKDASIIAVDRVPIVFCFADELEAILRQNDDETVLGAFRLSTTTERRGYTLQSNADRVRVEPLRRKPDPLEADIRTRLKWYYDWESTSGQS